MTPSILRRRTTAAVAALLLGLTLAACGGDDSDTGSDDPARTETSTSEAPPEEVVVPTEAELDTALVTAADVPEGFVEGEPEEDTDDSLEDTCLGDVGQFDDALGSEPDTEADTEFKAEDDVSQSVVDSSISAYADAGPVAEEFTAFVGRLQECTSVSSTDDDGVTLDLDISYDDAVSVPEADQQLRVDMTGTITAGTQQFDIVYAFVVVLSGNFISSIGTSQLGSTDYGVLDVTDQLATLQAERLAELTG